MKGFNMKRRFFCAVLVFSLILTSVPVFAEEGTEGGSTFKRHSLGLFAGPMYPASRFNLDQGYNGGLRYAFAFSKNHKIEVGLSYSPMDFSYRFDKQNKPGLPTIANMDVFSPEVLENSIDDEVGISFSDYSDFRFRSQGSMTIEEIGDLDVFMLGINYVYYHSKGKYTPFFPMGIGVVEFDGQIYRYVSGEVEFDNDVDPVQIISFDDREFLFDVYEPDRKWYINFGIGLEIVLNDRLSFKGEVRDYVWKATEIYFLNTNTESVQIRNDIWGHVFTAEMGIYFNF